MTSRVNFGRSYLLEDGACLLGHVIGFNKQAVIGEIELGDDRAGEGGLSLHVTVGLEDLRESERERGREQTSAETR